MNGEVYSKERVSEINRRIRIKDHALTMSRTFNGKFGVYDGHFEIDAETKHFDWSGKNPGQKPTQFIGIFELTGDRLKLCYRYVVADTPRPTDFKTGTPVKPGMQHVSLALKKVTSIESATDLKKRLAGTKWVDSWNKNFEWDKQGNFRTGANGKGWWSPSYKVVSDLELSINYGPDNICTVVFDEKLRTFTQYKNGNPITTGRRTN